MYTNICTCLFFIINWLNLLTRMFGMVLEKLFIPDLQKISGVVERKIVACGVTKLLCDCPEMFTGTYQKHWSALLQVCVIFIHF